MYNFIFTKYSEKQFLALEKQNQERIKQKLSYFKHLESINDYLKVVYNLKPATHRLRIWNYRLLLEVQSDSIIIYKIAHRKKVYK